MTKVADRTSPSTKQAPASSTPIQSGDIKRMRKAIFEAEAPLATAESIAEMLYLVGTSGTLDEGVQEAIHGLGTALDAALNTLRNELYGEEVAA